MNQVVDISIANFLLVYLLLVIVLAIMTKAGINKQRLLIVSSLRMTIQMVIAGLVLTYIFKNPRPIFTIIYVLAMASFSTYRVISVNEEINSNFKKIIAISVFGVAIATIVFFIKVIVGESIFNPQYTIPISGMLMGNTMTGLSLAVKSFMDSIKDQRPRIQALQAFGSPSHTILKEFEKNALETAMLPTINSMVGMGIVTLPGMMTGQMLAGILPKTAIMYQVAINISIATVTTAASFLALHLGARTMYDKNEQII